MKLFVRVLKLMPVYKKIKPMIIRLKLSTGVNDHTPLNVVSYSLSNTNFVTPFAQSKGTPNHRESINRFIPHVIW